MNEDCTIISIELLAAIKVQFHIDWEGIHGISHWARVYSNGMRLSEQTGANTKVVQLFAAFHDSRRYNESRDDRHGPRGAELAAEFLGNYFELSNEEFDLLYQACCLHTTAATHESITVQTCFDADRLDLGRVGIVPKAEYLCTDFARSQEMIDWAYQRSIDGVVPNNVLRMFVL